MVPSNVPVLGGDGSVRGEGNDSKRSNLAVDAPLAAAKRRDSRAIWAAIVSFVVATTGVALLARGQYLPLGGPGSLGTLAGAASAVLAGLSFCGAYALAGTGADEPALSWRGGLPKAKRIADVIALTAAIAMLSYFVVIAVAQVFQIGFRGLTVDPLGGGVLAGFAAAALSYVSSLLAARTSASTIAAVAVAVLFMGTLASMISSPDESWWQLHFSQLGNTAGLTGYRFNLALILTGLVITVLAGYVGRALDLGLAARGAATGTRVQVLCWLFAGIGICMIGVGLVPDAVNKPVHVAAAAGMVVLFAVFSFGALRFIPGLPRDLLVFTVIVAVGIVVAILLWVPIGYYSLAGMEFIAAGLLFAWLLVFARSAETYGAGSAPPTGS